MSGVYLAYDGSIHGDWISHYAARLAAHHASSTLNLVHVVEQPSSQPLLAEKLQRVRAECEHLGVQLNVCLERSAGMVLQSLCSAVAPGPDSYLVCGTRRDERRRGLLSGTLAERLLRSRHCNVLAIRVVQPGLLGLPRSLLLPVSGHPRGLQSGLPFLKLFAADIARLHLVYVERVARWRFRMLSHERAERLRQAGEAYCQRIEREINERLGLGPAVVDANVVVSDDVPKEIVIAAGKTRSRLIYMGASERNLTERLLYGNPIEQVLRDATCDVAVYRGVA